MLSLIRHGLLAQCPSAWGFQPTRRSRLRRPVHPGQIRLTVLTIGYYIDSLTIAMFCMVTLIASCIHVYSLGYMHEELHDVTDPLARWPTASRWSAAAASLASFSTCRSSASACWAW